jgi:hypothetical protein
MGFSPGPEKSTLARVDAQSNVKLRKNYAGASFALKMHKP